MSSPDIPTEQWACVIEKTGGPVEYKKIPVQKPGPDEVLINIKYSGVCHTDLHAVKGDWPLATKLPLVGGHEGAGVVVAKGEQVQDIEIGDHAGVKVSDGSDTDNGEERQLTREFSGSMALVLLATSASSLMSLFVRRYVVSDVACRAVLTTLQQALLSGYTVDGSFQQYAIAKAAHVARIDKSIPLDAIAPVLCAGITVYK